MTASLSGDNYFEFFIVPFFFHSGDGVVGGGGSVAVGGNDTPLIVFETTDHYDYGHTGFIDFFPPSKCSACKCHDCKEKHDGMDITVEATTENHNIRVDNPSTASKYEEKVKYNQQQQDVSRNKKCLINIIKGFSIISKLPWHLVEEVYIPINCGDEFHWVLAVIILKERYGLSDFYKRMDYGLFVAACAEYLSNGLQVPNDGLDTGLLHKRYATLLWKYEE
ncbi:hypothetical protein BC332_28247 [Capsicum chinense]|nr:hypothetical protein BC332_28247 [Capsicum chinense]